MTRWDAAIKMREDGLCEFDAERNSYSMTDEQRKQLNFRVSIIGRAFGETLLVLNLSGCKEMKGERHRVGNCGDGGNTR